MPPEVGCNWVKAAPQVGREQRRGKFRLFKEVACNDDHGRGGNNIYLPSEYSFEDLEGRSRRDGEELDGALRVARRVEGEENGAEESANARSKSFYRCIFNAFRERDVNRRKYVCMCACMYPRRSRSFEQQSVKKLVPFLMCSPSTIPFPSGHEFHPRSLLAFHRYRSVSIGIDENCLIIPLARTYRFENIFVISMGFFFFVFYEAEKRSWQKKEKNESIFFDA